MKYFQGDKNIEFDVDVNIIIQVKSIKHIKTNITIISSVIVLIFSEYLN
jgi:hypothetical protein